MRLPQARDSRATRWRRSSQLSSAPGTTQWRRSSRSSHSLNIHHHHHLLGYNAPQLQVRHEVQRIIVKRYVIRYDAPQRSVFSRCPPRRQRLISSSIARCTSRSPSDHREQVYAPQLAHATRWWTVPSSVTAKRYVLLSLPCDAMVDCSVVRHREEVYAPQLAMRRDGGLSVVRHHAAMSSPRSFSRCVPRGSASSPSEPSGWSNV